MRSLAFAILDYLHIYIFTYVLWRFFFSPKPRWHFTHANTQSIIFIPFCLFWIMTDTLVTANVLQTIKSFMLRVTNPKLITGMVSLTSHLHLFNSTRRCLVFHPTQFLVFPREMETDGCWCPGDLSVTWAVWRSSHPHTHCHTHPHYIDGSPAARQSPIPGGVISKPATQVISQLASQRAN